MEVAQRATMRSGWWLVGIVNAEVKAQSPGLARASLGLGPGGNHPAEIRRTLMDLALVFLCVGYCA